MNSQATVDAHLKRLALYDLHQSLGGKLVPFAGYEMPVQYPAGIKTEHQHTRNAAGLFDVSHMGQVKLIGDGAAAALESLVPVDIVDLPAFKQRYALFTNEAGGIQDDLMVTNAGDHIFVVVNAACKEQDIAHMKSHIGDKCTIDVLEDHALLALQGPQAAAVVQRLGADVENILFMGAANVSIDGIGCFLTRSGYSGEDGFEISVANSDVEKLAKSLLAQPEIEPVGLGARDSLRLEAGLCLYGHDLTPDTTPVEASLLWALSKVRREGGARAGGYPGYEIIRQQMIDKPTRKRVGFKPTGKAPIREGAEIQDSNGNAIGTVTSGGFTATVGGPVAMGYVSSEFAAIGSRVNAIVRGKALPMDVVKTPFVPQRYYRG